MQSVSIPGAAGLECRTGMLWIQGWKFPPNHQIWQQRKTQIDFLNELNTHAHTHAYTHTWSNESFNHLLHPSVSFWNTQHAGTHTHFLYDQSTSNSNSFKYSYKVLEDGWSVSPSLFLPVSLSPGILIIPPVSPPHRVGGFSLQTKFLEVSIN